MPNKRYSEFKAATDAAEKEKKMGGSSKDGLRGAKAPGHKAFSGPEVIDPNKGVKSLGRKPGAEE